MTFTERVRKLFLQPKRTYTLDEAGAFFDMHGTRFDDERFEPERGPDVAWREIVLELLTSHTLRMIEEALGDEADSGLRLARRGRVLFHGSVTTRCTEKRPVGSTLLSRRRLRNGA